MATVLDVRDGRLVFELDLDARQPLTRLSARASLSKAAVAYRLKNLEKSGIIPSYRTHVDFGRLGFRKFLYLLKILPGEKPEHGLREFAQANGRVFSSSLFSGSCDCVLEVVARGPEELLSFEQELADVSRLFTEKTILEEFNAKEFERAYLSREAKRERVRVPVRPVRLDSADAKILSLVSGNARATLVQIAKQAGVSKDVALYRFKQLRQSGLVSFRATLNFEKLGLERYTLLLKLTSLDKKTLSSLEKIAHLNKFVTQTSCLVGGWNFSLGVECTPADLDEFVKELRFSFAQNLRDFQVLRLQKILAFQSIPKTVLGNLLREDKS